MTVCRHLAILIVLFLTVFSAEAETHYKPHISVGGHAGMTMSEISFSPSVKQSWVNGMGGGVAVRYAEEKIFGLIAELNFEQRGWQENFEESPLAYSRTLTYLSVPFMTHIYFGSSRFKGFVNLGPEFGLLLGESTSSNFDHGNPFASSDFPTDNRMTEQMVTEVKNKLDYGITAGIGCEYYVHPRHSILMEARLYYGLGNIFPSSKADTFSASRNMSIEVTLGYYFRIK